MLLLAGCAATGGNGDGAGGHCIMHEVSSLTVLTDRGVPLVRAELNGTPVAFMVDTGAALSTVTTAVAEKLGLTVDYDRRTSFGGVGGSVFVYGTTISRLSFGTAQARDIEFWRADQPNGTVAGLPVGGLFGADFLAQYDVLFDLPNHRIHLFRARNCDGAFEPPLPDPLLDLSFELDEGQAVRIPIQVDDHPIEAILDSGSTRTVLDSDDAHAAGATAASLATDRQVSTVGIDDRRLPDALHEFRSLAIGGELRQPALLSVSDIFTRSLVGDDFFRRNQVWISYPHRMLFFHPVDAASPAPTIVPPGATSPR